MANVGIDIKVTNTVLGVPPDVNANSILLNALIVAVGRQKHEEVSGTFSEMERVWSTYSVFGKAEDE